MLFVFLHMFCVWMFLFFDFIYSITMLPVQAFNAIGKNVPNLQFWVSFLVKDTKCFEKTKDCLFEWFVSLFKFCSLNKFNLHFLHQFGSEFLCKMFFLSQIWGFILFKESFRARNCRDLQLCFLFFRIGFCFPKLKKIFSKEVVNRLFFWIVTSKMIFSLVLYIRNQVYCNFLRLRVELISLKILEKSPKLAFLFLRSRCQPTMFHS